MFLIKSGAICEVVEGREREFVSPFAEEIFGQDSRSWQMDAWKYKEDETEPEKGLVPRSMLWGGRGKLNQPVRVKASHVRSAPGRLYYVLEMTNSCGLFYYDFARDHETRLFHKSDFRPRGLFIADDYSIFTTVSNADGTVHLVELDSQGKRETVLTSGDCIDENPYRRGAFIYYQSGGIARDDQGNILATGRSEINTLDTDTGEIETILSSEKHDYLLPKVDRDGNLYCLQVPAREQTRYSLGARILDLVLFPWRLCVAIVAFLNVFSMFFAKKPLITAGGANPGEVDISRRILHNRVVNLQETMKREGRKVAVSKDWKLIRSNKGEITEIASNVLWYEIDDQGNLIHTDGFAVFDSHGAKQIVCEELVSGLALSPRPA